jgi:hypothetical protein
VPDAEARKMIDNVGFAQKRRIRGEVANVVVEQDDPIGWKASQILAPPVYQIIDDDHARAALRQLTNQFRADESGPARDNRCTSWIH